jgi:hypothetical protein
VILARLSWWTIISRIAGWLYKNEMADMAVEC